MDKEAATILADSIKELKSAIMFWAIAYKEKTAFEQQRVESELARLEDILNGTGVKPKNNDSDNDGN